MKVEYTGCCFRLSFELFGRSLEFRKYHVARRAEMPDLKKRLLRQIQPQIGERKPLVAATKEAPGD